MVPPTRHVILANFRLVLEPSGNGYNLVIEDHHIQMDDGSVLDASTHLKVAGPQIAPAGERRIRLRSEIDLPGWILP
jgi:hypothetical protein